MNFWGLLAHCFDWTKDVVCCVCVAMVFPSPDPPGKLSEILLSHVNIIPVLAVNEGSHVTKFIKANSVGIVPILKAQFNNPAQLQQFHLVFLRFVWICASTLGSVQCSLIHQSHPSSDFFFFFCLLVLKS
jgi:hypothetical protein